MDYMKMDDIEEFYTFKEVIGEGNFATVKKAIHQDTGTEVAIKSIRKIQNGENYAENYLKNECNVLFRLTHENIIEIYEVYDNPEYFYIVMEYVAGKDVDDRYIHQNIRDEHIVYKVIISMVDALEYCHNNNVVHRDLKPQNILLTSMDDLPTYKLADFGMARIVGDDILTTVCGTPNYFAPQILDGQIYTFLVDYWSLGVLMYHMLSGTVPFKADTIDNEKELFEKIKVQPVVFDPALWGNVSEESKDLILHLLDKNPKSRYRAADIRKHPWIVQEGNCK